MKRSPGRSSVVASGPGRRPARGKIALNGLAFHLRRSLERAKEIARLRAMPQLGAVAWTHPEVSHSRWEYVERTIEFCLQMRCAAPLYGRRARVRVAEYSLGAGTDLLVCWALIGSVGHLWGTFAAERMLMEALRENSGARERLLKLLPEEDREFAIGVLGDFRVYEFNQVLSALVLHASPELLPKSERSAFLEIARALREPSLYGHEVLELSRAFADLRRLAFLSLDLSATKAPFQLDREALSDSVPTLVSGVDSSGRTALTSLLAALNRHLRSEDYLSPDVVMRHEAFRRKVKGWLGTELERLQDPEDLVRFILSLRTLEGWPSACWQEVNAHCATRFHLHRSIVRAPSDASHAMRTRRWARVTKEAIAKERPGVELSIVTGPDADEYFKDVFVAKGAGPQTVRDALEAACELCLEATASSRPGALATSLAEGADPRALAQQVVAMWLPGDRRLAFPASQELSADRACMALRPEGMPKLLQHLSDTRDQLLERQARYRNSDARHMECGTRIHELRVLQERLEATRGWTFRIVMPAGFTIRLRSNPEDSEAQVDGAFIDLHGDEARLHLVEAKMKKEAQSEACAQLRKQLRRLKWVAIAEPVGVHGGGEVILRLADPNAN